MLRPTVMEPALVTVASLAKEVLVHPRIGQQGLFPGQPSRARLLSSLPPLRPFRRAYHTAIVVVDWDHRLPSQQLLTRIYGYYDADSLDHGQVTLDARLA